MDSNPSKSGRGRSTSGRVRGVILSPQGWQKFQTAKQQAESDETWGKHFTQEDLSDRTGLSLNTLTRLFKREQGIDRQSLEYLFRAFGLEVTKADFTSPIAADEASETRQVNPPQDWDTAVDASVFYGREASREKPRELALMEGAQGLVKSLLLSGLSPDDGRTIFRQKGAFTGSEAEWQTLIHHYGGNPLALKLVAAATQDLFNGSITEVMPYLSQGLAVFEDIRDLLARQFNRLSEAEQNILSWFAILREPVAIAEIRENVVDHAVQQNVPNLINSLFRRSLIEKIDGLFFLQPVVMEYVTERFMQQICIEFETQQLNVWQTHPLLRVQAKEYIREIQTRLIVQPVIERFLSCFGSVAAIEAQARHILKQQRKNPGYAAGNLINLLVQLQVDLRGSDFSDLVVQQADLRQVDLARVNFQNANLAKGTNWQAAAMTKRFACGMCKPEPV